MSGGGGARAPLTLAVDLGGTHMRCAIVSASGEVTDRREAPTARDGTGTAPLVSLIRTVAALAPCQSAVMGVPGRVDYREGRLEEAANLPPDWLPGLTSSALGAAVGLPVALANDADLAAVGEAYFGAGQAYGDVAYITLSTGVGAGVVLGGALVHGRRSMAEVGHQVIALGRQPDTLEDLASGTALGRAAAAAGIGVRGQDVVDAVAAGNPAAARIWDDLVAAAAVGLVNLAWAFSPEVIVIGGGLGLVGPVLLDPLRAAMQREGPPALDPPIAIVAAALGDDAGLAGAGAWARAFHAPPSGRS